MTLQGRPVIFQTPSRADPVFLPGLSNYSRNTIDQLDAYIFIEKAK